MKEQITQNVEQKPSWRRRIAAGVGSVTLLGVSYFGMEIATNDVEIRQPKASAEEEYTPVETSTEETGLCEGGEEVISNTCDTTSTTKPTTTTEATTTTRPTTTTEATTTTRPTTTTEATTTTLVVTTTGSTSIPIPSTTIDVPVETAPPAEIVPPVITYNPYRP